MIIYVSPAEFNGGILQFSTTITRETKALSECRLFLPEVIDRALYADISGDVICYDKVKTLNKNNEKIHDIAKQIMSFLPECVIFVEDSILMQQLNEILHKNKIKTAMIIHDIRHHVYRKMGMRKIAVDIIRRKMTKKTSEKCDHIILLSNNSEKMFRTEYNKDNGVVFKLPAHVPMAAPKMPEELFEAVDNYFLFFGRIDEYKGIERLCEAYTSLPDDLKHKCKLVIAGKGRFSNEESNLINTDRNIISINRFIEDGEMVWLFEKSKAVIMPYIEASQSGVLPIAYKFGKPVIVSNLQGLTENVQMNRTGCAFDSTEELTKILSSFDDNNFSEREIFDYYENDYSWKNNLKKLFMQLQIKITDNQ